MGFAIDDVFNFVAYNADDLCIAVGLVEKNKSIVINFLIVDIDAFSQTIKFIIKFVTFADKDSREFLSFQKFFIGDKNYLLIGKLPIQFLLDSVDTLLRQAAVFNCNDFIDSQFFIIVTGFISIKIQIDQLFFYRNAGLHNIVGTF